MLGKKMRSHFVCQACGTTTSKWLGRCPGCQAWSTLAEELVASADSRASAGRAAAAGKAAVRLRDVEADDARRLPTGLAELDRVLGGGLVRGSLVLVGGDPGIGKSTLLLQALTSMAGRGHRVVYLTGEESAAQVKLRASRLGALAEEFYLLADTRLEALLGACEALSPTIVVVDSIQTVGTDELDGSHGSVGQIRAVTQRLMRLAKEQHIATFIVGHVTKEGSIAGPKVMEHMVDTVLYFEGDRTGPYRLLRSHKNRFGSAQEIGVFEMNEMGLVPVPNPSALFLAQRAKGPGAVVVTQVEGSRPLLLEVQALVTPSFAQGNPRRSSTGFDPQRTAMLCAVLNARTPIDLAGCDIFVNVVGGVRLSEPAADLGVCLALASAARGAPVPADLVAIGEVGLSGEIRSAASMAARLAEADALGFGQVFVPKPLPASKKGTGGPVLHGVETLAAALQALGLWNGRTPHNKAHGDSHAQRGNGT